MTTPEQFLKASILQQIRMVTPIARVFLVEGIDVRQRGDEDDITVRVEKLIGHCGPPHPSDEDCRRFLDSHYSAYVIGIAVGLLLRPDAVGPLAKPGSMMGADVKKGGVR